MKTKDEGNFEKDNCLTTIEEKPVDITYQKWKEMNDNVITNLQLPLTNLQGDLGCFHQTI